MNKRMRDILRWLLQDAYERFWNFETLKGVIVTIIGIYLFTRPEYALRAVILYFTFYEGPRKILANRVKQRAKEAKKAYEHRSPGQSLPSVAWPVLVVALILFWPSQEHAEDPPLPCLQYECAVSQQGIDLIKRWEGYVPIMYRDAAGYWTIGTGHLMTKEEIRRWRGKALTASQGDSLLRSDLHREEGYVQRFVHVELWPWQYDALVSWTFNLGGGNLRRSTLLRRVNARQHDLVPHELKRWNRAGGRVLRGLVRRRAAEARMYAEGWQ